MNVHKRTRLTRLDREKLWSDHCSNHYTITQLAERYRVSRPTIYKTLKRARVREFTPRDSANHRYKSMKYGLKRLAKVEHRIEEKKKAQAKRYNKCYPGEMVHFDTKRLPKLKGEDNTTPREYLFVAIDDFSRELYAAILPDKTQFSAEKFLSQVVEECPYTVEYTYSDNGKEYKGTDNHAFVKLCNETGIGQRFTRPKTPRTNGKAERVIRTLMEQWHSQEFKGRKHRKLELIRYINYYNTVKPHKGINHLTPYELLMEYFYDKKALD